VTERAELPESLPLFPLPATVLFPGMRLPLYIFEDRYRQLVTDCILTGTPFAILLATASEVADSPSEPYRIGTAARIYEVERNSDGTMNISTVGGERVEVVEFDRKSKPYLVGKVLELPLRASDPAVIEVAAWDARELFPKYLNLLLARSGADAVEIEMPMSPQETASIICANLQINPEVKQALLEAPNLQQRLDQAVEILREELSTLERLGDPDDQVSEA